MRPVQYQSRAIKVPNDTINHTEEKDECSDRQTISRDKPTQLRRIANIERFADNVDKHQTLRESGFYVKESA